MSLPLYNIDIVFHYNNITKDKEKEKEKDKDKDKDLNDEVQLVTFYMYKPLLAHTIQNAINENNY